jgi:hypothetical protein
MLPINLCWSKCARPWMILKRNCAAVGPGVHGFVDDHHGCTLLPIPAKSSRHPKLIAWEAEFDVPTSGLGKIASEITQPYSKPEFRH